MQEAFFEEVGGPEVIRIHDVPEPVPSPGEVLVRTHAVDIGRADINYRRGFYPWPQFMPACPGWEGSGVVESLGEGVTNVKIGDPVYLVTMLTSPGDEGRGFGREKLVVSAERLVAVPEDVDLQDAATTGYYAMAWNALREGYGGKPRPDQNHEGALPATLLQIGAAGAFGTAFVQVAKALGIEVIGTISSEEKAAFASSSGADHTINYRTEDVHARVLELTNGRGVDMIVDHIGGPEFGKFFDTLAPWGTILVLNLEAGDAGIDLLQPVVHSKRWPAVRYYGAIGLGEAPEEMKAHCEAVLDLMAEGKLHPRIGTVFPLEEVVAAQTLVEAGALGYVVLQLNRA
ncbi:quinone oxidoreductase family protein [Tsukamurella tyrosinosolvens]|uniref:quinone oxidoreductase family protein n=1 Tax=Tsukamurella tyrosinosolvens TaxID=57704 RepID=UPI0007962BF7|nr:zinc-binding dehydrogenase [Tsukamurella tyrosinosolvens]KXP08428.1 hypothetical protein AXK59_23805 [Tsukamurella tyrosinosolvens]